jgi:hypothetical protein
MSGPRDYFAYQSDDGKIYVLRHNRSHLQALGIPTCQPAEYLWPPGDLRPRYVVARHGKSMRQLIVDDVNRPVWTGEAQTLQLPDWRSAPAGELVAFRITMRVSERVSGTRTTYKKRKLPLITPRPMTTS